MAAYQNWQKSLLRLIGAPVTRQNLRFLSAWQRAEGGSARFNPLNTTWGSGSAINSVGVRNYGSAQEGSRATANTLLGGPYKALVRSLRAGNVNPGVEAQQLGQSPWGTSGSLVNKILGGGNLPAFAGQPLQRQQSTQNNDGIKTLLAQQIIGNLGAIGHHQTPDLTSELQTLHQLRSASNQGMTSNLTGQPLNSPISTHATGTVQFDGKPVAAWIASALRLARKAGWTGTVSSGYRSVAEQARIYNSGVRPAALPGHSNHNFTAYPGGAVDVTNASQLAQILHRLGITQLQWAGAKDPVHFSHPRGGHY